jgi:N-acetylneuraminic acid mutarotase
VSYDPVTGELLSHAPMPRPRGAGGIAAVDGRIYYFGGLVLPNQTSAQADVYDIATDTWSPLPDLPVAKDHFKAAVIGTDIHLPGGRSGTAASAMTRHDVYDTLTGTYRSAAALPVALGGSGLAVLGGTMVIAGGEMRAPDAARHDVFAYDPAADSWSSLEPMHVARHGFDLAACGNALYVAGGMGNFGANNTNDTVEAFTIDGAPPECPLTAPPGALAARGGPSVLEPAELPEVRRIAARMARAGGDAGLYCSI